MQFKLFSIAATGDSEAEEELNRFLRGHRAISVQKELVQSGQAAFWCFCIEYLTGVPASDDRGRGRSRIDYKAVLSEEDFAVFARLRDVRKQLAADEAIPVYALFARIIHEPGGVGCKSRASCGLRQGLEKRAVRRPSEAVAPFDGLGGPSYRPHE